MKPATAQDYLERIVRTLIFIEQHLDDDLDLDQLADAAAFSRFHFHRIFRGLVGEPAGEYIRRLRLERAARNLKQPGETVTETAFAAGFETHEAFTRAFGAMFGESPSAYRAARGNAAAEISPVEVKDLAPTRIVFLRHVGPYAKVGETWGRLMAWAGRRGLLGAGMTLIGIAYDDPDVTPAAKIRYDAALTVNRPVEPEGEFGVTELAGGRYAVFRHKGPYEELGKTYQQIYGGWLPASGCQLRDVPAFEQYLNSPQTARPEDLITLIHIPV